MLVFLCRYDIVENEIPDGFRLELNKMHQWEADEGRLPQKWKQIWDKVEGALDDTIKGHRSPPLSPNDQVSLCWAPKSVVHSSLGI